MNCGCLKPRCVTYGTSYTGVPSVAKTVPATVATTKVVQEKKKPSYLWIFLILLGLLLLLGWYLWKRREDQRKAQIQQAQQQVATVMQQQQLQQAPMQPSLVSFPQRVAPNVQNTVQNVMQSRAVVQPCHSSLPPTPMPILNPLTSQCNSIGTIKTPSSGGIYYIDPAYAECFSDILRPGKKWKDIEGGEKFTKAKDGKTYKRDSMGRFYVKDSQGNWWQKGTGGFWWLEDRDGSVLKKDTKGTMYKTDPYGVTWVINRENNAWEKAPEGVPMDMKADITMERQQYQSWGAELDPNYDPTIEYAASTGDDPYHVNVYGNYFTLQQPYKLPNSYLDDLTLDVEPTKTVTSGTISTSKEQSQLLGPCTPCGNKYSFL